MFNFLKNLFGFSKPEPQVEVPYKLEPPAPVKCGCGRSPTGNCVGLHKLSDAEWSTHADNPAKVVPVAAPVVEAKPAKKPRVKKAVVVEKPAKAAKAEKPAKINAPRATKSKAKSTPV